MLGRTKSILGAALALSLLLAVVVWAEGNFTGNGDGTVTDNETGLMWQQNPTDGATWEAALLRCENMQLAGYEDWRLPNIKELQSIIDHSQVGYAIDPNYFDVASDGVYWSSTTTARSPSDGWAVTIHTGTSHPRPKTASDAVRCVRSGLTEGE